MWNTAATSLTLREKTVYPNTKFLIFKKHCVPPHEMFPYIKGKNCAPPHKTVYLHTKLGLGAFGMYRVSRNMLQLSGKLIKYYISQLSQEQYHFTHLISGVKNTEICQKGFFPKCQLSKCQLPKCQLPKMSTPKMSSPYFLLKNT